MDYSHGVTFTVQDAVVRKPLTLEELDPNNEIEYVYVYWNDLSNTRRCRIIPISYFRTLLASNRPGVNIARVVPVLIYLNVPRGFSGVGELLYKLDTSTMVRLHNVSPRAKPVLGILGNFEEKGAKEDGSVAVNHCPRTLLRRVVDEISSETSTKFLVGFESEFILLKMDPATSSILSPLVPSSEHQFSSTAGTTNGLPEALILLDIADTLIQAGIQVQMVHTEGGPGQYEVVTGPLPPLEAADALVYTREVIYQVSAKHGLHATFAPRPFAYSVGSSTHAHVSVHDTTGKTTKVPLELSQPEQSFLAGLLDHLPAVAAITLPCYASYHRAVDGVWSGGTYVAWGTENRECPVRLVNASSPSSRNFELRFIDATANPHLALAAVLGASKQSLLDKAPLTIKNSDEMAPAQMTEERRKELGIEKRLPDSPGKAREYLQNDEGLKKVLGEDVADVFCAVNETLEKVLQPADEDYEQQLKRLVEFF